MRTVVICALGALALAACQRPAETPAADEAAIAADAVAADTASTEGGSGSADGAAAAGDASADTSAMAPAEGAMAPAPSTEPQPVTDATRAGAKEKAEETNLHP